jgi:hypothetical protein
MAMIFPGMDPYIEDPRLWPGVHSRLVVYLADQLELRLGPRYVAAVEERVFIEGPDRQVIPDVWVRKAEDAERSGATAVAETDAPTRVHVAELEVHESYIEILDLQSGKRVVTVIEVVSPANKFPGKGRQAYQEKQGQVLRSDTHLVEIDLLRAGQHVAAVPEWRIRGGQRYDYLVCVNRAQGLRDWYDLYPRRLRERLPRIGVPLAGDDPDVPLDLQTAIAQIYEAGGYRRRIDYGVPCQPPLSEDDQAWANELLRPSPLSS